MLPVTTQAYRIDHILGFFRIWEIPGHGVSGLLGRFSPAVPLHKSEFEREGVWDFGRLTKPHITAELLVSVFGEHWEAVVREAPAEPPYRVSSCSGVVLAPLPCGCWCWCNAVFS